MLHSLVDLTFIKVLFEVNTPSIETLPCVVEWCYNEKGQLPLEIEIEKGVATYIARKFKVPLIYLFSFDLQYQ